MMAKFCVRNFCYSVGTLLLLLTQPFVASAADSYSGLVDAIADQRRGAADKARDVHRHPLQTLQFFDVQPDMSVVEITPGQGWYTDILASYLSERGKLYAAHFPVNSEVEYFKRSRAQFEQKLAADQNRFGQVILTTFHPPSKAESGPAGKIDRVLTFRNVHNWVKAGYAEQAFTDFFTLLKPNGVLGVVEHRAKAGTSIDEMIRSGYMTEAHVIELAQQAGFELEAKSEVNANPNDTTVHPVGVWTLPPSLRLGDTERERYQAIGESDRMTLRFRKPAN